MHGLFGKKEVIQNQWLDGYNKQIKQRRTFMKKLLLVFTFCMGLLVLNHTQVKAYTVFESKVEKEEVTYLWTTTRVNFRTEPNTSSDIIETLDKRTKVQMKISSDKWVKVEYKGKVGYVYKEYTTNKELFTSDKNRWGIELTNDEIDLLAKILWIEARGECDEGEIAVVECTLNRIVALQFPDTLEEVLSQDGQYSSWKLRNKANPTDREYKIIRKVLNGETDILSKEAIYFSINPRNKNIEKVIGNHYFCREDD